MICFPYYDNLSGLDTGFSDGEQPVLLDWHGAVCQERLERPRSAAVPSSGTAAVLRLTGAI